jgi:hypothetical protein
LCSTEPVDRDAVGRLRRGGAGNVRNAAWSRSVISLNAVRQDGEREPAGPSTLVGGCRHLGVKGWHPAGAQPCGLTLDPEGSGDTERRG